MSQSKIIHIESNTKESKGVTIDISADPKVAAGKHIGDILAVNAGRPVLLLIAGGSAVSVLDYINPEYLDENITITVTDERFTEDIGENNFENLQTTSLYNDLIALDAFCINTSVRESDTVEIHAERFEKNIREWQQDNPKGVIVALYGMGADGHIGGIIPGLYSGSEFQNKFNSEKLVSSVVNEKALKEKELSESQGIFPLRVSTTFTFMKKVDFPVMYITGDAKKAALEKALKTETDLVEIPARIILDMKAPVIFTDISIGE